VYVESLIKTQPKSVSFEPRGTAHDLTSEEMAAMLLGVHDGVFYLAMDIVGGQDNRKIVTQHLYDNKLPKLYQNYRMSDSESGRGVKDGFLWNLVYLAVTEYIDPCKCVSCGGGEGLQTIECLVCGGQGNSRLKDEQKARYLKIKPKRFEYWQPLYENIRDVISSWESEARRVFNSQGYEI
jgi:hypothetical protein